MNLTGEPARIYGTQLVSYLPKNQAVRLWIHECERVFRDRMVSDADAAKFDEFRASVAQKFFEDVPGGVAALESRPLIYTSFMQASLPRALLPVCVSLDACTALFYAWTRFLCSCCPFDKTYILNHPRPAAAARPRPQPSEETPVYTPVPSHDVLRKVLDDKLAEYNETNTCMDLVLFQQAMEHVTRIARIMDLPRLVPLTA